jgi:hypothetical protein
MLVVEMLNFVSNSCFLRALKFRIRVSAVWRGFTVAFDTDLQEVHQVAM